MLVNMILQHKLEMDTRRLANQIFTEAIALILVANKFYSTEFMNTNVSISYLQIVAKPARPFL